MFTSLQMQGFFVETQRFVQNQVILPTVISNFLDLSPKKTKKPTNQLPIAQLCERISFIAPPAAWAARSNFSTL